MCGQKNAGKLVSWAPIDECGVVVSSLCDMIFQCVCTFCNKVRCVLWHSNYACTCTLVVSGLTFSFCM